MPASVEVFKTSVLQLAPLYVVPRVPLYYTEPFLVEFIEISLSLQKAFICMINVWVGRCIGERQLQIKTDKN